MLTLAITLFLSGVLVTGLCLPMVYGKLPMNAWYGMRTKNTLDSLESWQHLNEVGGMLFSLLGFPLMLGGVVGFFLTDAHVPLVGLATSVVSLVSVGLAAYLFVRYSNRYAKRVARDAS